MKLLTKNTLIFLIASLAVFAMGGWLFYKELNNIIDEEATENLYFKKKQIEIYTYKHHSLPNNLLQDEIIAFTPVQDKIEETSCDTLIYNTLEGEILPYRSLSFCVSADGKLYKTTIYKPLFESEDLTEAILTTLVIISTILILVLLSLNYIYSRSTWRPFFRSIERLRRYKPSEHAVIKADDTNVYEFKVLNDAVETMTQQIQRDFISLKTFTENASHEIQTPLAIIRNKIENLLQTEGLNESQSQQLLSILEAITRLSRLNQSLLLLARIENGQFKAEDRIDMSELLMQKLQQYDDLFNLKELGIQTRIKPHITIHMHAELAGSIISNLVSNAIKYTEKGGSVHITLTENKLEVSNHGAPLKSDPERLFERFYKGEVRADSTGLGLALVKEIASLHGHRITYAYNHGEHCFCYHF